MFPPMPSKNRLFLLSGLVVLLAVLAVAFSPFAVSNGIRLWIWWAAKQEGFIVSIDQIDASFLRPVVIRQLHLKSMRENALRVDLTATDASVGLNFKHILLHMRGRIIHSLSIRELHVEVRRTNPNVRAITRRGWSTLQRLLPEDLTIANSEMRVENGPTLILLRRGFLSASETEAGRFSAAEIMIASPWLRQTFSQLRGATHWEANRLTLGGLTLSRGLDLQSATADLSRLGKQRVGVQFDVDVFGGKIRGNISHEWHSQHSNWKIAGGASDISLAQTSEAFGFADRVDGLLHAANFTFRGNLAEPDRVTASLWTELTAPTWHNRTAEAIMVGAAIYNRKIELQQLYIRQKSNQFTLSGEAAFPANASGWLSPDFRGNISASINQLGDFVGLFGASPDDFGGKITIEGAMDTRDRKFGGHLAVEGASLTFFKTAVDILSAKLNLKATELEIEQLDLKSKNDLLTAQGKVDISHEHNYSGTLDARADDLLDYFPSFRGPAGKRVNHVPVDVQATINSGKWDARGAIRVPDSSPISFTANFSLPIGTDWNAFQLSPLNVTFDFPSVFLAKAPQLFHPGIFQDGIVSGSISLSETLQHPRIDGDVQLINGKLSGDGWTSFDFTEAGSRIAFAGNRASVEFLNVATKDADLSLRGEIDFEDINDVTIRISGATPIFDLTSQQVDCVNKIKIVPAVLTLAPAVAEFELRGGLFKSGWMASLHEATDFESLAISDPDGGARKFPLCLGTSPEEKTLLLGAPPRSETGADTSRPKKQEKPR
ncbi:MAG: hypothetical protein DME98_09180 [Verrucomicrobia bacterium]|nr:MAG: hypothetical protein DME98_09180 [Verrucomicrobiota bacterium]PYJ32819.1 MAG: hypothetical protein DME88_09680 [Verrucomicrobiota bacterium]